MNQFPQQKLWQDFLPTIIRKKMDVVLLVPEEQSNLRRIRGDCPCTEGHPQCKMGSYEEKLWIFGKSSVRTHILM